MKILLANKFFFLNGGAEISLFETARLLQKKGHEVIWFSMKHEKNIPSKFQKYFVSKVDYEKPGLINKIEVSLRLLYSLEAKRNIKKLIAEEKPDSAHLNNIYHQLSPSIIHAIKECRIPVVMTLRDFKMVCPSYVISLDGKICEDCKGGNYYHCFLRKCSKGSRMSSLLNTIEMYLHHKILHIYDLVDVLISPSIFLKTKMEEMGFKRRIDYLPNFVNLADFSPRHDWEENSIVYFGRVMEGKGLFHLFEAMKGLDNLTLKIIGEGPLKEALEFEVERKDLKNVKFLGFKTGKELHDEIRKAMFVVMPSELYENNPRTIIEGFALGKPAIGSRIGGIPELVRDRETGLTFETGNANDLRNKIQDLINNPDEIGKMGKRARAFAEDKFNEERHYSKLLEIYKGILGLNGKAMKNK